MFSETYNQVYRNKRIKEYANDLQNFFISQFKNILEIGKSKGVFESDIDSTAIAGIILMTLNGVIFFVRNDPGVDLLGQMRQNMLNLLFNTILKK